MSNKHTRCCPGAATTTTHRICKLTVCVSDSSNPPDNILLIVPLCMAASLDTEKESPSSEISVTAPDSDLALLLDWEGGMGGRDGRERGWERLGQRCISSSLCIRLALTEAILVACAAVEKSRKEWTPAKCCNSVLELSTPRKWRRVRHAQTHGKAVRQDHNTIISQHSSICSPPNTPQ